MRSPIELPIPLPKPRHRRMTMCVSASAGPAVVEDALVMAGAYVDNFRIGKASAAIADESGVRKVIEICRQYDVDVETGGPMFEIAFLQDRVDPFFEWAADIGFTSVEMSENLFALSAEDIRKFVPRLHKLGLHAYYEFGNKYPDGAPLEVDDATGAVLDAMEAGVRKVVIERAQVDVLLGTEYEERLTALAEKAGLESLVFEAGPNTPSYAASLLRLFGADVNLGNIRIEASGAADNVMSVENARRGLDRGVGYSFIAEGAKVETFSGVKASAPPA